MKDRSIQRQRQSGVAMILMAIMGLALLALSVVSVDLTLTHSLAESTQKTAFMASEIAESGAAQALALIKEGGVESPVSGGGSTAQWVSFSGGEYYYYTAVDTATGISSVRAWGRVALSATAVPSPEAPDSSGFDKTGWLVRGIEITVHSGKYVPEAPLYFGNGGPEEPLGGFDWSSSTDPADPSTWSTVTSSPASYQASWVPFQCSSLDHPIDYLYNGGTPEPATTNPHPYHVWGSQNTIGQFNIEAWFANSAGAGNDPTINVTPPPTSAYYDTSDPMSPDYPWPVNPNTPDVQTFAAELWNEYKDDPAATKLASGSHSGTYGDLSDPRVTFVTGTLQVDPATTFSGAGVLVVRDDYDPNVDTNNTPSTKAYLNIQGTFEWTGVVIVAGWAPTIDVAVGGDGTIVGALFGEDTVQSGSEISLDSATIVLRIEDDFRILYSSGLFGEGGFVQPIIPTVNKQILGIKNLD